LRYLKLFKNFVLLLTIPPLVAYPQAEIHNSAAQYQMISGEVASSQKESPFSYDDVLDLLEELEEGDLEDRCGPEGLLQINRFMAHLAQQGLLPGDIEEEFELEKDIQELVNSTSDLNGFERSSYLKDQYVVFPAIFYNTSDVVLCKNWAQKGWKNTKKFVKKHKKAIIIGAVIVVAITAVLVVAVASSAGAAATAAAAAGASLSSSDENIIPSSQKNEDAIFCDSLHESQLVDSVFLVAEDFPTFKNALDEQISSFKEMVVEDGFFQDDYMMNSVDPSFKEKARSFGAFLAHETLVGISQLASFVPQLGEEIKNLGGLLSPIQFNSMTNSEHFRGDLAKNYERLMASGHQKIDQFFSTDQSDRYTPEAKASQVDHFSISVLPPPGILGPGSAAMSTDRLTATQASNVWGWSLGRDITNRTFFGTIPKWSTVRRRYWKNRAEWAKSNPSDKYLSGDILRMENGLAPQKFNTKTGQFESMELHHMPAQKDGGLFDFIELWPEEHAKLDPYRHIGK